MRLSKLERRTQDQVSEHYEVEKRLAARLRSAPKEQRRELYNAVYDERLKLIPHHPLLTQAAQPERQSRAVAPQARLLRHFVQPSTVFLEVGPGDCALALEMTKFVAMVYAVDVSEGLVHERDFPENFELRISDGVSVPVAEGSVDVVYSNQVMEHLHPEDALEQLQNIYNTLVSGGIYICVTPNRLSGPWDISRDFDKIATGLHLKEWTITELEAAFRVAGFSDVIAVLSYHGHILSPWLPVVLFRWAETLLKKLPSTMRRRIATLLTAVKLIAIK